MSKKRKFKRPVGGKLLTPSELSKIIVPPPIILKSRRGTKTEGQRCSECGAAAKHIWRYAESNRGVVYLCSLCKNIVFDRSFDHVDAMSTAIIIPFESNPRKH